MLTRRSLLMASAALLLIPAGCSPTSGPEPIAWGRDACEHCRMIISEARFAAEARGGSGNRLYKFDDIGCAAHWLKQAGWREEDLAEFWVMNHEDGQSWLDARQAAYLVGVRSPMGYDFAAVPGPREDGVSFEEMRRRLAVGVSHSQCPVPATNVAEAPREN